MGRGTAVVTGASSGIGAATARQLAAAGYDVVVGARRVDRLAALAAEIGGRAHPLDVTDDASVQAFVGAVPECAVLVNNAGGAIGMDPVATADPADWRRMYDVNVLGVLRMTQALLPKLVASGAGHVVVMGSTAGRIVYEGGGGYTAAKHGAAALAETLRLELVGEPVRVTEIAPGMVATEEFSLNRFGGDAERAAQVYAGVPNPLTADDVADCVTWAVTRPRTSTSTSSWSSRWPRRPSTRWTGRAEPAIPHNHPMTAYSELVAATRRDGAALAAAGRLGLAATIASCPGWDVGRLLLHTGRVYAFVTTVLETRATGAPPDRPSRPPPDTEPVGYLLAALDDVVAALTDLAPDSPVWNWSPRPDQARFWGRRMALETAVHRWDAEHAHGIEEAVEATLARDGVEELFDALVPRLVARGVPAGRSGTIGLHATDVEADWTVTLSERGAVARAGRDGAECEVSGRASELLLLLYNRLPSEGLDSTGDTGLLDDWAARFHV